MKPITSKRASGILKTTFLFVLFVLAVGGCKEDSGPTGPFNPPTYPNMTGHWTGTGSWWDSYLINASWTADFAQETDSTFGGTMTDSYTVSTSLGVHSLKWLVKGKVTMSGLAVIAETSMVIMRWPSSPMTLPYPKTYSSCKVSAKADTTSYIGPSPQPSATPETFMLVKEK